MRHVLSEFTYSPKVFPNFVNGRREEPSGEGSLEITNPATGRRLGKLTYSSRTQVDEAVGSAQEAFEKWASEPVTERVNRLIQLHNLLKAEEENIARLIVQENGKTVDDARGEVKRGIENVEASLSAIYKLDGRRTVNIAPGIDEELMLEPLGVFAAVTPFNFPMMIPFWFIPYALATGNTFVLKPSDRTPTTMNYIFSRILEERIFPDGVLNLINGGREVVEQIIDDNRVAGVSFVGSTAVGRQVFDRCCSRRKRVQVQASAKNFIVVMPDAKLDAALSNMMNSFYGNAGERCLAGSNLVCFERNHDEVLRKFVSAAASLKLGYGLDETVAMGPLITREHLNRVKGYIEKGIEEGAAAALDGREITVHEYPEGNFLGPTVLDGVQEDMAVAREEIFGPVASFITTEDLDESIEMINRSRYGNMAVIYTSDGAAARRFRLKAKAGNIGINVGVAAPAATYPFGGCRESFFGQLHGQGGEDYLSFYTDRRVAIERWL
ncbi:MAG: CoA-acylating methylmalonate-semialdehyde dehydrogenase [Methanomassiliicoccales archaeon]